MKIFGTDIAKLIAKGMSSAGGLLPCTVRKYSTGARTPGDLVGGTNDTHVDYPARGARNRGLRGQTLVQHNGTLVLVLGYYLPDGVEIEPGDEVLIEGQWHVVAEVVGRDPASAAWELRSEEARRAEA